MYRLGELRTALQVEPEARSLFLRLFAVLFDVRALLGRVVCLERRVGVERERALGVWAPEGCASPVKVLEAEGEWTDGVR